MCAETGEGGDSGRWLNPPHVCGQSSPMVKDCSFGVVREGKGVEGVAQIWSSEDLVGKEHGV